jgi:hypothetical protein
MKWVVVPILGLCCGNAFAEDRYIFSDSYPPLLARFGITAFDIPHSALIADVGETHWTNRYDRTLDFMRKYRFTDEYPIERYRHWVITSPSIRFAEDGELDITVTLGYSKTQMESVERATGVSFGASGNIDGISLTMSQKNELKIT